MSEKTIAGVLFATAYLLIVEGICNVPSNFLPTSLNEVDIFIEDLAFVYTDTFENCTGHVTSFSVCYLVMLPAKEMTIFTVDEESTIVHTYDLLTPLDGDPDTECFHAHSNVQVCCTQQTLSPSEQFEVQSNHHYGIWSRAGLAVNESVMVLGHYVIDEPIQLEVGVNINSVTQAIEQTHFFLNLTTGDSVISSQQPQQSPTTTSNNASANIAPAIIPTTASADTTTYYLAALSSTDTPGKGPYSSPSFSTRNSSHNGSSATNTNASHSRTYNLSHVTTVSPPINRPASSTTTDLKTDASSEARTSLIGGAVGGISVLVLAILVVTLLLLLIHRSRRTKSTKKIGYEAESVQMEAINRAVPVTEQDLENRLMEIQPNPSYVCSGQHITRESVIYSYVQDSMSHVSTSSALIPTSPNEAYGLVTTQEANHLKYDAQDEERKDSNSEVNDDQLCINEAYSITTSASTTSPPNKEE